MDCARPPCPSSRRSRSLTTPMDGWSSTIRRKGRAGRRRRETGGHRGRRFRERSLRPRGGARLRQARRAGSSGRRVPTVLFQILVGRRSERPRAVEEISARRLVRRIRHRPAGLSHRQRYARRETAHWLSRRHAGHRGYDKARRCGSAHYRQCWSEPRAIEPTIGVTIMERNRGVERVRDLARGPGRLCEALGIDRRLDGIDLCQAGPLSLGSDGQGSGEIGQSKRIGITRAADSPLRFYVRGNWFVSGSQALNR